MLITFIYYAILQNTMHSTMQTDFREKFGKKYINLFNLQTILLTKENFMKRVICLLLAIASICGCLFMGKARLNIHAETNELDLKCTSYVLVDYNTGKVLSENNKDEKLQVASMVKLMTALLTMEKIENNEWSLDTKLMTSEYAASMEGSQAFLDAGQEYTVDELLKSVIVASANDSCVVIAENFAGSEKNFTDLMNKRAKELGMNNTYYENSTGLPSPNEYSTSYDISIVLREVCKHELYHKYATIWMDSLTHKSGRKTELVNTNRLIRYYDGCDCGKTGFTDEAGYCLSASALRNGLRLVSVVTGCKSSQARFEESSKLLNYGFANFESKKVVDSQNLIDITNNFRKSKQNIEVMAERDCYVTSKRGDNSQIETKVELNKNVKLPISKNQTVGKVLVIENGIVVDEVNLLAKDDYKKQSYMSYVEQVIENWAI